MRRAPKARLLTPPCSFTTTRMLARANLLRPLRASTSRLPALAARHLATEASPPKKSPRPAGFATVEELHSRTAADILAERDAGSHAGEMRHFTVNFG